MKMRREDKSRKKERWHYRRWWLSTGRINEVISIDKHEGNVPRNFRCYIVIWMNGKIVATKRKNGIAAFRSASRYCVRVGYSDTSGMME